MQKPLVLMGSELQIYRILRKTSILDDEIFILVNQKESNPHPIPLKAIGDAKYLESALTLKRLVL